MKLKLYLLALLTIMTVSLHSQNKYYYYNKKKIEIEIDKNKVDVQTNQDFDTSILKKEGIKKVALHNDNSEKKQLYKRITIELEESTDEKSFSSKINSILAAKGVTNISPYFKRKDSKSIGTSNIFYVKLNKESDVDILKQLASKKGFEIVHQNPFMPLWYQLVIKSKLTKSSVDLSNELFETGLFDDVDPGFQFNFKESCTNDPAFSQQWGLYNSTNPSIDINACDAWAITQGSGVMVAVVDQGIYKSHNDLAPNISGLSYNTQSGTVPSLFINGNKHGTHVAGIIAAVKDNNLQVTGVAPQSKLMSISHTLQQATPTLAEELANGINWAWQHGADIINNSWGDQGGLYYNYFHSAILENSIINAFTYGRNGRGTIVVFSSGNHRTPIDYPGNFHNDILCVGSINSNGLRSSFSAWGNQLDLVAPGGKILSTVPNQAIDTLSGTSMAAPHVTGVAALLLSVNPDLTMPQVNKLIETTAQKIGNYSYINTAGRPRGAWNIEMGYGLVDAYAAVLAAQQFPKLSGPSKVCYSPSTTFYLQNGGSTVTWEVSYNLEIVSSNNTSVTVRTTSTTESGKGYIKAILPNDVIEKKFPIGVPYLNYDDNEDFTMCRDASSTSNNFFPVKIEGADITPVWEVEPITNNFTVTMQGNEALVSLNYAPPYNYIAFRVRASNSCGFSEWLQYYISVTNSCDSENFKSNYIIYPNPTSEILTVLNSNAETLNSEDKDGVYELYDFDSNLVSKGDLKSKTNIDTSKYKKGRYILKINVKGKIETNHIIIN